MKSELYERPILGITMGDPAGCGPEITVKALRNKEIYDMCRPLVVGDSKMFEDSIRILRKKDQGSQGILG